MGNAFIVTVVPEEALGLEALYDYDEHGKEVRIADLHGEDWARLRRSDELFRLHPRAFYRLAISHADVWELPIEPRKRLGLDWHRRPAALRAHTAAVSKSLERFINSRLKQLAFMVRSGWWVLGRARVKVTDCSPVSERKMRALTRAMSGSRTRRRPSRTTESKDG